MIIPGSKYLANRLLIIACLAEGESVLKNFPQNHDIEIAQKGIERLGAIIRKNGDDLIVTGTGGKISGKEIYTGENGTFSRFVVSLVALGSKPINIDSAIKMKERPMEAILEALITLGASVESNNNSFPMKIAGPLQTGNLNLSGELSSQYFSSLLLTLPYAHPIKSQKSLIIPTSKIVSKNYIYLTCELMKKFGVEVKVKHNQDNQDNQNILSLEIPQGKYHAQAITLEADPVSSTYFLAAAALAEEEISIENYNFNTQQGEVKFLEVLEKIGCKLNKLPNQKKITLLKNSHKKLKGIKVNMQDMPDAVQTLAVLAASINGTTTITGISHLRYKESNRIEDTAKELRKAGTNVKTGEDWMVIKGGKIQSATLDSHNDHRMVMSLSLLSLHCPEIKINNYLAINKSFPSYFDKLQELGFMINYE